MNYQILLNGKQVASENAEQLTDNFTIENFPSPNPRKTQIENIKVWKTGDEYDGYKVYEQAITANGIHNPIKCVITDLSTNETIFNGFALPYAESTLLKTDGEGNSVVMPLVEEETDFDKICESVHLRRFISVPYVYNAYNATTNYGISAFVSYENNIYQSLVANVGKIPNSLNTNIWQIVGAVPYPGAFTNTEYEIIYCVEEQPDSQKDATFWGLQALTLLFLVNTLIDAIRDSSAAAAAFPAVGLTVIFTISATIKFATIIIAIYQLLESIVVPIRKYYAIKVRKILEKAFDYLGYKLKSSILNSSEFDNLVYIAATNEEAVIKGKPKNIPIPDMNLLEFMSIWANMFNAKFKPIGNISNSIKQIYFENISFYWQLTNPATGKSNSFIIPKMQNNGNIQRCNFDELHSNYSLSFTEDASDMGNHKGSKSLAMTANFTIANTIHKSIKALQGSNDIVLPISLAAAKGGDSFFQKLFNSIYDLLSDLFGNVDKGGDRRNMLLIPNNNIGVDKVLISDGKNLIAKNNSITLNAANLYTKFHKTRTIKGGFQFVRISQKASFVQQARFVKELFYWNVCKDEEGITCIVTKFTRNVETKLIDIEYRYQEEFLDSTKITETISVG